MSFNNDKHDTIYVQWYDSKLIFGGRGVTNSSLIGLKMCSTVGKSCLVLEPNEIPKTLKLFSTRLPEHELEELDEDNSD